MDNIPTSKRTPSSWQVSEKLQESVSKYVAENGLRHKLAQDFGDFLLSTQFANCDKFKVDREDLEGEEILVNKLKTNITCYGLMEDDMTDYELILLKKKLGENYKSLFKQE